MFLPSTPFYSKTQGQVKEALEITIDIRMIEAQIHQPIASISIYLY